jgi:hypothetical protein
MPIDPGLIFPFAGSVLVCGREQLLLYPELRVSIPEPRVDIRLEFSELPLLRQCLTNGRQIHIAT